MDGYMQTQYSELEQMSDEALCTALQNGTSAAGDILAHRYRKLVRCCAHPYFLAGGDSEDLLQEGMFGLIKAMREFRADREASFQTFAEVCIRSRLCSVIRASRAGKHSPLNESVPLNAFLLDAQPQYSQLDPEDLLIDREKAAALLNQVRSQLSELEVRVLDLYLDGCSCGEIAATVGKSYKSVDNAVQRIRRKIGRQISSGEISNG
ncbi:MAG: sigma-70 family RNA polymerase sigma factor [Firmicutes bacterium]|jgi:RNA polymerase sporulation-specific sigma factor|nr:sigma-70 family RNA polymerase sigma factor [Bacillota bacterium]HCO51045.1 RNA polymerase subunit sigma [Oscillibacter sp.]HCX43513.1 RNA polymerase subunit sigma [Oscillibacter sp.]